MATQVFTAYIGVYDIHRSYLSNTIKDAKGTGDSGQLEWPVRKGR